MSIDLNLNKSTATNFVLVFPKIPTETTISANRPLTLNIFGTVIPSFTLDQTESRWMGGRMIFQSGSVTFDQWPINFIVDSQLKNWKLLYKWMTAISNNKDKYTDIPENYQVDASLNVMDNYETSILRVHFRNVWPQSLGEVAFSQREGENIVEASAVLLYDRFEIEEFD